MEHLHVKQTVKGSIPFKLSKKAKSGSTLIENGLIQWRLAVTLAIEARKAEVVARSDCLNGLAPVNVSQGQR